MDSNSISFLLFHAGDGQWVAAPPGFQTLLRHPVGRGRTRAEAIDDLVAHPEFIHRAQMGEWSPAPQLADFVELHAPKWTTWTPFTTDVLAEVGNPAQQETTRAPGRDPAATADTVRTI